MSRLMLDYLECYDNWFSHLSSDIGSGCVIIYLSLWSYDEAAFDSNSS